MNNYVPNNAFMNPGVMNYGYNQPKMPNFTNPLTAEDMNLLKQKAPQFSLAVSQIENLKSICTHRDKNGETLIQNPDGSVTCTICHSTFKPVNANMETVEQIFRAAIDALETIKIMYMDIPDDVTRGYFQMIPFLEKGPQLYKIALDHYSKYSNPSVINRDYNGANTFALFSQMFNPGMGMGMGMPQQQMPYGYPMGQPGMAQPMNNPVPDVTMGANPVAGNPFDVSSNMGGMAQPSPAMEAAKQTTTDNKQYSL